MHVDRLQLNLQLNQDRLLECRGRLQANLAEEEISWKFNLSRAPWWGGQVEGLVGLFKRAFYKTVGGGMLSWVELSEVVLEVETQLNRRPLSYVEDDVQLPVLTSASILFQRANRLPELEPWRRENRDLRKRAKHLKSCKLRCTLETLDAGVPCRTLRTTWPCERREAKIFEDRGCCHYPLRGEEPRPVAPRNCRAAIWRARRSYTSSQVTHQ